MDQFVIIYFFIYMKDLYVPLDAVLLCGGKGTRLQPITKDKTPKSLYPVDGIPLIQYSTDSLSPKHVRQTIFAVDHHAGQIITWVNNARLPYNVVFSPQETTGVLAAINSALEHAKEEEFVSCNTDEVRLGLDMERILRFHQESGTLATVVAAYTNNLYRHRLLTFREKDKRVISTSLKSAEYKNKPEATGFVNTGFFIMDMRARELFNPNYSGDWSGIIDPLCDAGQLSAFVDEKIIYFNIGTPDELNEATFFLTRQKIA